MFSGSKYRYIGTDLSMGLRHNRIYTVHLEIWPKNMGGGITVEMSDFFGQIVWRCPYATLNLFNKNWVKI